MYSVQLLMLKINKYLFKYSLQVGMSVYLFFIVIYYSEHNIIDFCVTKCSL